MRYLLVLLSVFLFVTCDTEKMPESVLMLSDENEDVVQYSGPVAVARANLTLIADTSGVCHCAIDHVNNGSFTFDALLDEEILVLSFAENEEIVQLDLPIGESSVNLWVSDGNTKLKVTSTVVCKE